MAIQEGPFMRITPTPPANQFLAAFGLFIGWELTITGDFVVSAEVAFTYNYSRDLFGYSSCSKNINIRRPIAANTYYLEEGAGFVSTQAGDMFGFPPSSTPLFYYEGNKVCDGFLLMYDDVKMTLWLRDGQEVLPVSGPVEPYTLIAEIALVGKEIVFERDDIPGQLERYRIDLLGSNLNSEKDFIKSGGPFVAKNEAVDDGGRFLDNTTDPEVVFSFLGVEAS